MKSLNIFNNVINKHSQKPNNYNEICYSSNIRWISCDGIRL